MNSSRRDFLRQLSSAAFISGVFEHQKWTLDRDAAALVSESSPRGVIRLDRSGNPYGPSPAVVSLLREALPGTSRHAEGALAAQLRDRIAAAHRVDPVCVVLGCGSGDILRMAADAFTAPDKPLVVAVPTFEPMNDSARRRGAPLVEVPLNAEYAHDLQAALERATPNTGLFYICNPHNSTGTITPLPSIEAFLEQRPSGSVVIIDEAYHEYAGSSSDYRSFIATGDDRVIVTRTFSKIYGLAELRIGYAVTSPDVARLLERHSVVGAMSSVALLAALAALEDQEYVRSSVERNIDDRQEFVNAGNARMIHPVDSRTNIVLIHAERPGAEVVSHFQRHGIVLTPPLPYFGKYVRVAVGTPGDMREFWRVWDLMPRRRMSM